MSNCANAFATVRELFARHGIDRSSAEGPPSTSRMLDGRSIHFYFQFVEPILCSTYPNHLEDEWPEVPGRSGAFSLSKAAGLDASPLAFADVGFGVAVPIYAKGEADAQALDALCRAALHLVRQCGLLWLCALGIGGFVANPDSGGAASLRGLVRVDSLSNDVRAHAIRILEVAAANFVSLWLEAEMLAGPCEMRFIPERALQFSVEVFSRQISDAFYIRLEDRAPLQSSSAIAFFDSLDEALASFPLTKHLLSYWYPHAAQEAFMKGSPFDTAPNLASLYRL